jgi:hypothetical protein
MAALTFCKALPQHFSLQTEISRYVPVDYQLLDIIHRPVFYLERDVSETGFCLRLQVIFTQMGPTEKTVMPSSYYV